MSIQINKMRCGIYIIYLIYIIETIFVVLVCIGKA
jgi:hypothetical protein